MRAAILLVSLALALAACGSPRDGGTPRTTTPTVARPAFEDQHLRQVRMTSGRALGYVQPETASQILCQLLSKDDWVRLLDGDVGRKPLSAPYAGCQIATRHGMVSMQLLARDAAFVPTGTVAGRPSTMAENTDNPVITVALSDDALQPAPRQYYPVKRLLELTVIGDDAEFGKRVLDEIVPVLVRERESLPGIDAQGHLQYVATPPTDEFVDLPKPVQALQMCTALRENLKMAATRTDVFDTGRCAVSTADGQATLEVDGKSHPPDYPTKVAGRPAWTPEDPSIVRVLLRDDAGVELFVSAPDPRALAEKVVPLFV